MTSLLIQRRDPENRLLAAGDFRTTINILDRQAKESQDSSQRRVAPRVIRAIFVGAYQQGVGHLGAKDYAAAVLDFVVATETAPNDARVFFDLACAYALDGQKGKALQTLRKPSRKALETWQASLVIGRWIPCAEKLYTLKS